MRPGGRPSRSGTLRPGPVLTVFCAGALVRLLFVGSKSFWHDEAMSLMTAAQPSLRGAWDCAMAFNFGAPAYALVLRGWLWLGTDETTVRLLSVAGSLVALGAALALARTWLAPGSVAAGLWLVALLPFSIEYAQEARVYAWLAAFELVMALALARMLEGGGRAWRVRYGAALAAGAVSHPGVWAWWGAQLAGLALTRRGRGLIRGVLAASLPALAVAGAFALATRAAWAGHLRIGYLRPAAGEFLRQTAILFAAGHHAGPVAGGTALWAFPVLAVAGAWALGRDARRRPAAALLSAQVVVPVAAVYAGIVLGASAQLRYVPAAPVALALLVASGAGVLPAAGRATALAAMLAVSAAGYHGYLTRAPSLEPTFCRLSKPALREAAAFIRAGARPGDVVVHLTTASWLPMCWYAPELRQGYVIGNPDFALTAPGLLVGTPVPLGRQLDGAKRVWLVSCPWRFRDDPAVPAALAPELSRRCATPQVRRFDGLDVYLADVIRR